MRAIVDAAVLGTVLVWLLSTIVYQIDSVSSKVARWDVFTLLPRWTFFAPNPATRDLHVIVRDRLEDGSYTDWIPVRFGSSRSAWSWFWHPSKRPQKVLSDAGSSIKRLYAQTNSTSDVQFSLPYLIILCHCMFELPGRLSATARQFALIETSGRENRSIWIRFTSDFHQF